jgi:cell wall-associated NlpC family hydrolase
MSVKTALRAVCLTVTVLFASLSGFKACAAPELPVSPTTNPAFAPASVNTSFINVLQQKYADMMSVIPQDISNLNLYGFIDQWFGTRYLWGGTTKNGIDCSAFVQKMYQSVFNMPIFRTAITQFGMCRIFNNEDSLKEGDLVFFKTIGNNISHVGVYLKNNYFVHSCSSKGVTISSLDNNYWAEVYAGSGRITMR